MSAFDGVACWSGGVVEWWSGGVVEWWSGGVVEWWSGGVRGQGNPLSNSVPSFSLLPSVQILFGPFCFTRSASHGQFGSA
jgi:hypothetical protein